MNYHSTRLDWILILVASAALILHFSDSNRIDWALVLAASTALIFHFF